MTTLAALTKLCGLATAGSYPAYINLQTVPGPTHDSQGLLLAQPVEEHVRITVRGDAVRDDRVPGGYRLPEAHIDLPVSEAKAILSEALSKLMPEGPRPRED